MTVIAPVPVGQVRDTLLYAVDLIEQDGWEPWPKGEARGGPRNLHAVLGDAAEKLKGAGSSFHLWVEAHDAVRAVLDADRAAAPHDGLPQDLSAYDEHPNCTTSAVADLLGRAANRVAPPPSEDE